MAVLPADQLYQVSFTVENVGKTIEKSKKRVTWVFGQGNKEFTVTFLWSKKSGKRLVYMSNAEVYFETRNSVTFFHKFKSADEKMNLHILATSVTPSKKFVSPNFLKYELIINGQRFAKLPKRDGTPTLEAEPRDVPESIFDIMYPQGYRENQLKSDGVAYRSKSAFTKDVNQRIIKQENYKNSRARS